MSNRIDWELCQQLANHNPQTARELLKLLLANLPQDLANIQLAYQQPCFTELQNQVHRLLGALCYCGVPDFKAVTGALYASLKNNDREVIAKLFREFEAEAGLLLKELEQMLPLSSPVVEALSNK